MWKFKMERDRYDVYLVYVRGHHWYLSMGAFHMPCGLPMMPRTFYEKTSCTNRIKQVRDS